jgi:hypothetical protein
MDFELGNDVHTHSNIFIVGFYIVNILNKLTKIF